jgi:hypothetical protein
VGYYQYPSCLVDGDNLLIGYSVDKEDIEVARWKLPELNVAPA